MSEVTPQNPRRIGGAGSLGPLPRTRGLHRGGAQPRLAAAGVTGMDPVIF